MFQLYKLTVASSINRGAPFSGSVSLSGGEGCFGGFNLGVGISKGIFDNTFPRDGRAGMVAS